MSAAKILNCRPQIAEPIAQVIGTKAAAGWSAEAITTYIRQMNPAITTSQVRQILALR